MIKQQSFDGLLKVCKEANETLELIKIVHPKLFNTSLLGELRRVINNAERGERND